MIKRGSVVSITYVLTNQKNEQLDKADLADPFLYLHGYGQLVGVVERALEGLKAGDAKKVTFQPKDKNHPLAGDVLSFDAKVLSVREATPEELTHGHAHGKGGHSHS